MVRCGLGAVATFLVAVLAGLAGPAAAQVVELFRSFREDPLSEAAEFVAACSLGEFTVTVEAGLRDRKITLMLKGETPAEALQAIAKAAGAYVHRIDAKRYEIRSQPPTGDSGAPAPAAEPPPRPEWARAMQEKLAGASMPGAFTDTPLERALVAIGKAAGVPIVLDPEVRKARTEQDLTVDVHISQGGDDPFGKPSTVTAESLLDSVLMRPRVVREYRWRCVYVSTPERLAALPVEIAAAKDGGEELKEKLAGKMVTAKLARASLKKAVQTLKEKGGLPLRIDPEAEKAAGGRTFDADLAAVPLADALGLVFLPAGLDVAAEGAGLVLRPRP